MNKTGKKTWKLKDTHKQGTVGTKVSGLGNHVVYANTLTAPLAGFKNYFIRIVQEKNQMELDNKIVIMVMEEIVKDLKLELSELARHHFNELLIAMFHSVRLDSIHKISVTPEDEMKKVLNDAYSSVIQIPKKDIDSEIPVTKVVARFKYFEKVFEKRNLIQNYDWNYRRLNEDAFVFIKEYEKSKMNFTDYCKTRWNGGNQCEGCHCPFVPAGPYFCCTYCSDYWKIDAYIKFCNFFRMMGNMYLFHHYIPESTLKFFLTHKEYNAIFNQQVSFSPVKKYCIFDAIISNWETEEKAKKQSKNQKKKLVSWSAEDEEKKPTTKTFIMKKRRLTEKEIEELERGTGPDVEFKSFNDLGEKSLC